MDVLEELRVLVVDLFLMYSLLLERAGTGAGGDRGMVGEGGGLLAAGRPEDCDSE